MLNMMCEGDNLYIMNKCMYKKSMFDISPHIFNYFYSAVFNIDVVLTNFALCKTIGNCLALCTIVIKCITHVYRVLF